MEEIGVNNMVFKIHVRQCYYFFNGVQNVVYYEQKGSLQIRFGVK